jgi:L-threonylcarbamoyladenylate synthase
MVLQPQELRAFGVSSRGPLVVKPTQAGLLRAARLVRSGGVVAFPTDTVYGLGASADDEVAQKRVYQIKGRPVGMPLILMVAAESQLEGLVHVDSRAEAMMRKWWPGPLTLILHSLRGGTLGVRIPKHKVALGLLRHTGPLMTTSANLHGRDPAMNAQEAGALAGVMAVIDGGAAPGGTASTVLDLTGPEPHVLREGAIPTPELLGPPAPRSG